MYGLAFERTAFANAENRLVAKGNPMTISSSSQPGRSASNATSGMATLSVFSQMSGLIAAGDINFLRRQVRIGQSCHLFIVLHNVTKSTALTFFCHMSVSEKKGASFVLQIAASTPMFPCVLRNLSG